MLFIVCNSILQYYFVLRLGVRSHDDVSELPYVSMRTMGFKGADGWICALTCHPQRRWRQSPLAYVCCVRPPLLRRQRLCLRYESSTQAYAGYTIQYIRCRTKGGHLRDVYAGLRCFCHFFTLRRPDSCTSVHTQKFTCVSSIMSLSVGQIEDIA